MSTVTVYVRCEVLDVRLELGPVNSASTLETLVLRAVEAGVRTVGELASLFCVSSRLMVDLLGDLWRAGRVTFEFGTESEEITLSPAGAEELDALEAHSGDDLANRARRRDTSSTLRTNAVEELLLDTLTGRIIAGMRGFNRPREPRLLVTRMDDDSTRADVKASDLTAAISRNLERLSNSDSNQYAGMRVEKAYLTPHVDGSEAGHRYVGIDVKVAIDTTDQLVVRVDDPNLSPQAQRIAMDRLTRLVEANPYAPFVAALRAEAGHVLQERPDIRGRLDTVRQAADTIGGSAQPNRRASHDRLGHEADLLVSHLRDMVHRQVDISPLTTKQEHSETIRELIGSAHEQVVFAVPWIRYEGLAPYLPALKDAVRRGVRIIVLWGIERDESSLPDNVLKALDDVVRTARSAQTNGDISFLRDRSSHVHAKVVVSDAHSAVVTSMNYFSDGGLSEFGVLVSAGANKASPAITGLLDWAYHTVPDYGLASRLTRDPQALGSGDEVEDVVLPAHPRLLEHVASAPADSALVRLWADTWGDFAREAEQALLAIRPVAYLVRDHQHSALMRDALREARRHVLIASDQFSSTVVTANFIDLVRQSLERGVHVDLVYRRLHEEAVDLPSVEKLRELGELPDLKGRLTVRHVSSNHAKMLLFDDEALVGSYNYLSFESQYGPGRRRRRSEVSIRLRCARTTARFAAILLGDDSSWRGAPTEPDRVVTAGPVADVGGRALEVLTELRKGTAADQRRIAALCLGEPPFAVTDALLVSGVPAPDLERVYAALFASASEEQVPLWGERLLTAVWRRGDWATAHVLRVGIAAARVRPRLVVTSAAAVTAVGDLVTLIEDAALSESRTTAETEVLSVIAGHGLLTTGEVGLLEPLALLVEPLRTEFRTYAELSKGYLTEFGPLRSEVLDGLSAMEIRRSNLVTSWKAIDVGLDNFVRYRPNCRTGDMTKDHLCQPGGQLDVLRRIVDGEDLPGLVEWWASHGSSDAGRWLDRATRAAMSPPINNSRRRSMLIKSRGLLNPVKDLVENGLEIHDDVQLTDPQLRRIDMIGKSAQEVLHLLTDDIELEPARRILSRLAATEVGAAQ